MRFAVWRWSEIEGKLWGDNSVGYKSDRGLAHGIPLSLSFCERRFAPSRPE